jgi:hypothetical protein
LPQQVICKVCNEILYYGDDLKSPEEIFQGNDGKCKKCGKEISLTPQNVEVKPNPKKFYRRSF